MHVAVPRSPDPPVTRATRPKRSICAPIHATCPARRQEDCRAAAEEPSRRSSARASARLDEAGGERGIGAPVQVDVRREHGADLVTLGAMGTAWTPEAPGTFHGVRHRITGRVVELVAPRDEA